MDNEYLSGLSFQINPFIPTPFLFNHLFNTNRSRLNTKKFQKEE